MRYKSPGMCTQSQHLRNFVTLPLVCVPRWHVVHRCQVPWCCQWNFPFPHTAQYNPTVATEPFLFLSVLLLQFKKQKNVSAIVSDFSDKTSWPHSVWFKNEGHVSYFVNFIMLRITMYYIPKSLHLLQQLLKCITYHRYNLAKSFSICVLSNCSRFICGICQLCQSGPFPSALDLRFQTLFVTILNMKHLICTCNLLMSKVRVFIMIDAITEGKMQFTLKYE